jgi:hypothetical protein
MESFFFGNADRKLYGVFHAADPGAYRNRSILLLYPIGQEYMRIHRAYRRLADSLSELGFDVLRFDYACTGDSYGEFENLSVETLSESALAAYDELRAMSPDARIDVVALRLGTVVARHFLQKRDIRRVVLWEPYYSDGDFVLQWQDAIRDKGKSRANFIDEEYLHFNGFAYSSAVRESLTACDWSDLAENSVADALVISTRDTTEFEVFRSVFGTEVEVDVVSVAGPDDWTTVDSVGGIFLPEPSLVAIRNWLAE